MRVSPSTVTCFNLFVLCLLSLHCASAQSASQPSITGISGCNDVGVTTWNCSAGATVTVTGAGFLDDPRAYMSSDDVLLRCIVQHPIQSSSFACYLESVRPPTWPGNVLERSVVYFPTTNVSSPAFYGFAMTHTDMPYLTGVYGCDDSNNAAGTFTRNCQPDSTVLTVVGLHFSVIPTMPATAISVSLGGKRTMAGARVVNDTVMTIALSAFYARVVLPDHYSSQPLPLIVQCGWYSTNSVNVSLVSPIPPPQVTAINNLFNPASGGCQGRNVTTGLAMLGCVPGVSSLLITGHYFYQPMQAFVGGQPCAITTFSSTQMSCTLPVIPNYIPGRLYDLVLNDSVYADDGDVGIVPQAVSFVGGAVLVSALPCAPGCGIAVSAKCQAGQVLTIQGVGFTTDPAAYMTLTNPRSGWSGNCSRLVEVDQYTYACTLPALPADEAAVQPAQMSVALTSQGKTSSPLLVMAYDSATPISISAIQGCGQTVLAGADGSLSISNCYPTDWLTMTGQNFQLGSLGNPPSVNSQAPSLQMAVTLLNSTSLIGFFRGLQTNLPFAQPVLLRPHRRTGLLQPLQRHLHRPPSPSHH